MGKREIRRRKAGKRADRRPPTPPSFLERNGRAILGVVVLFLLVAGVAYVVTHYSWGDDTPETKVKAPLFKLTDIDGKPVHLEAYRGRIVVLDLFATWCGPCHEEMGHLNDLRAHFPEEEVVIISIDIDPENPDETEEAVRAFRDQYHANWVFAMDTDHVNDNYGTGSIPTLVIIDRDGYKRWQKAGTAETDELVAQIEPLL